MIRSCYPRAETFLELLTKEMILSWLKESVIGRQALMKLEKKLTQHR